MQRPCGPTDKASDYGSGDSRFESWQGRLSLFFPRTPFLFFFYPIFPHSQKLNTHIHNASYLSVVLKRRDFMALRFETARSSEQSPKPAGCVGVRV